MTSKGDYCEAGLGEEKDEDIEEMEEGNGLFIPFDSLLHTCYARVKTHLANYLRISCLDRPDHTEMPTDAYLSEQMSPKFSRRGYCIKKNYGSSCPIRQTRH